jgi:hypothetical protein
MLCDGYVILAVYWVDTKKAVEGIQWNGRILIDATNAHADSPADVSLAGVTRSRAALAGRTSSESLAGWGPWGHAGQVYQQHTNGLDQ